MKCTLVRTDTGMVMLSGSQRFTVCRVCRRLATRECDWKVGPGKTCDMLLCDECATQPAPDKDLCPNHSARWLERQAQAARSS